MQNFTHPFFNSNNPCSHADNSAEAASYGFRTAPSKGALRNIMAFSRAYEVKQTISGRLCEMVLN